MLGENAAVVVLFLVARRVDWEPLGSVSHLLVADCRGSDFLQSVNPAIAHAIGELLLLPPCNLSWQHVGECLTDNLLLHCLTRTHLELRVDIHSHIEEFLVEERHTSLNAPCG